MSIDFAYPWWISYGHLVLACVLLLVLCAVRRIRVLRWLIAAALVWAFASFLIMRVVMNVNGRASLPTGNFLRSGTGRVLDMGAGTGRSSIMVLEARPRTTLVALDLFGDSYDEHFGDRGAARNRLLANWKAAGVDGRASIEAGDMRKLPFDDASFDAVVSSYAIDHLRGDGIRAALREALRVLKPRGEFLLSVIGGDAWLRFAFGPVLAHGGFRDGNWWSRSVRDAGFEVKEAGRRPGTIYVLAMKPGA